MEIKNKNMAMDGTSREYISKKNQDSTSEITADYKIRVFISSKCGDKDKKYIHVRKKLKELIERTGLAEVYLYEKTTASSLLNEKDYLWHLADSDVCIFLIDNVDGVTDGVQKEIDYAKDNDIISLYYFCKGRSNKKTAVERSIIDSGRVKSQTVDKFEDLIYDGAKGLINEIVNIYHCYCNHRFVFNDNITIDNTNGILNKSVESTTKDFISDGYPLDEDTLNNELPKSVLKNLSQCKRFLLEEVGFTYREANSKEDQTNKIDDWGLKFLGVLFQGHSIKDFNLPLFMETLKTQQDSSYHKLVCKRWDAIQAYFLGDVSNCVKQLEEAYRYAKTTKQASWLINDILIDIKNQQINLNTINNSFSESWAQKELNDSEENVNYPLLDRFYQSLQGKYINEIFKEQTQSPYSVTIGYNYDDYGDLFAGAFMVALCNGSLTHLLLICDKLKEFSYFLSSVHQDGVFKRSLFKFAAYAGDKSEVTRIRHTYPEAISRLDAKSADDIMKFCENHTIAYQRLISQLLVFGAVGYYLEDADYKRYEDFIVTEIIDWLENENRIVAVGNYIFECLKGVNERISQDQLAKICILFMEKQCSRWYRDLFRFIAQYIDITKMNDEVAADFVASIIELLGNEDKRKHVELESSFLFVLRNQDRGLTENLDKKIKEVFPDFYEGVYKLETSENPQNDFPAFIKKYTERIKKKNETQGENGRYVMYGSRDIATVRAILMDDRFVCPEELMDELIATVADTLLVAKEGIDTKMDAISLLNCIVVSFPEDYNRNIDTFNKIIEGKDTVIDVKDTFFNANIDKMSLVIGMGLLQTAMGIDAYNDLLEGLAYIHDNPSMILAAAGMINEYLEVDKTYTFPETIDILILQNVLQWLDSDSLDVRYHSTEILLQLLRNPRNQEIINQKVIHLIDTDEPQVKNLIMKQMECVPGVNNSTRKYIASKCKNDSNYVVRMVYKEACIHVNE